MTSPEIIACSVSDAKASDSVDTVYAVVSSSVSARTPVSASYVVKPPLLARSHGRMPPVSGMPADATRRVRPPSGAEGERVAVEPQRQGLHHRNRAVREGDAAEILVDRTERCIAFQEDVMRIHRVGTVLRPTVQTRAAAQMNLAASATQGLVINPNAPRSLEPEAALECIGRAEGE